MKFFKSKVLNKWWFAKHYWLLHNKLGANFKVFVIKKLLFVLDQGFLKWKKWPPYGPLQKLDVKMSSKGVKVGPWSQNLKTTLDILELIMKSRIKRTYAVLKVVFLEGAIDFLKGAF